MRQYAPLPGQMGLFAEPAPPPRVRQVVALSGGKDSTALALRLREVEPDVEFDYICTPTGDEPDELFAHLRRLREMLGRPILPIMHPLGLNGLIDHKNALPNWRQRWCTLILKIGPCREWLAKNAPAVLYVGLRADEEGREGGHYEDIPGVTMRTPFRDWGWGIGEVLDYLKARDIEIPPRTDCDRCFFQTLWEWYALWRDKPEKFEHAAAQERRIGHTFRSPGRDTQPAALDGLREKFEAGYVPKERRRDSLRAAQCRTCSL